MHTCAEKARVVQAVASCVVALIYMHDFGPCCLVLSVHTCRPVCPVTRHAQRERCLFSLLTGVLPRAADGLAQLAGSESFLSNRLHSTPVPRTPLLYEKRGTLCAPHAARARCNLLLLCISHYPVISHNLIYFYASYLMLLTRSYTRCKAYTVLDRRTSI